VSDEYCYSTDEEHYHGKFATREEALAEAMEYASPGATVWTGVAKPLRIGQLMPDANHLLEHCGEQAYERAGEAAEGWPACSKAQEADLEDTLRRVLDDWANKHGLQPAFYEVEEIQQHVVPEAKP
jgi:hypothetical protein